MQETTLPGERVELRLRPSPASWLPRYAAALSLAAWGATLWFLFDGYWNAKPTWWDHLSSHLLAASGLCAVGSAWTLARQSWTPFVALAGTAAGVTLTVLVAGWSPYWGIPLVLAVAGILALAAVEADRMLHAYRITNLRIVGRGGFGHHHEWHVQHTELADLDVRQGMLARALGFGTLVPVPKSTASKEHAGTPPQLRGVRPVGKVRTLIEALAQDATATPFLRKTGELERKVADAVAAFQRRGA